MPPSFTAFWQRVVLPFTKAGKSSHVEETAVSSTISLGIHALLLLVLALVITSDPSGFGPRVITMGTSEVETLEMNATFQALPLAETHDSSSIKEYSDYASSTPNTLLEKATEDIFAVELTNDQESLMRLQTSSAVASTGPTLTELLAELPRPASKKPVKAAADGVSAATSTAEALEGILNQLRNDLAEGQTYIVWVLDSSLSLVRDRQQIADQLQPFFEEYKHTDGQQPRLMSAVVAFGAKPIEVETTTAFPERIMNAIRSMPIDDSGIENVMTAVQVAVEKYSIRAKGRLRIVLWTDESGDDLPLIESTIALCQEKKCVVHVVGPTSVLGTDAGLQPYTDPVSNYRFLLPVKRGPDSCLPERVRLPYWFDLAANGGMYDGVIVADGMPWYGGVYRERLLSGTGPWCLTRLALQTGGSYTLLDREGEARAFDLDVMKSYLPDYGSMDKILEYISDSPFRSAVHAATQVTYSDWLNPPEMHFIRSRSMTYPFEMYDAYYPPTRFRALLKQRLSEETTRIAAAANTVERALQHFPDEFDWENAYANETSRRWRAWYDLTRGRLLMTSIRQQEYLATCRWVLTPGNLSATTNQLFFKPFAGLTSTNELLNKRRIEAARLLTRCTTEHAGTPWALLADWELATDVGIKPIQTTILPAPSQKPMLPPKPPQPIALPRL